MLLLEDGWLLLWRSTPLLPRSAGRNQARHPRLGLRCRGSRACGEGGRGNAAVGVRVVLRAVRRYCRCCCRGCLTRGCRGGACSLSQRDALLTACSSCGGLRRGQSHCTVCRRRPHENTACSAIVCRAVHGSTCLRPGWTVQATTGGGMRNRSHWGLHGCVAASDRTRLCLMGGRRSQSGPWELRSGVQAGRGQGDLARCGCSPCR